MFALIMLKLVVPLVVALSTAIIIHHTLASDNGQEESRWRPSFDPANVPHRRRASREPPRQRRRRNSNQKHKGKCVVCFEDTDLVEISPCKHRQICKACIIKIICENQGTCPLCREKIKGYADVL